MSADPKLLCDEMLARLGRWLRAAGYDTAIAAGGTPDTALTARAVAERRILITRDRHLAGNCQKLVPLRFLCGQELAAQARELRKSDGIDWLKAPFTRCLVDNTLLVRAPPELAGQIPPQSRAAGAPLQLCPSCRRIYWPGGHVRRMTARLRAFNED